MLIALHKGKGFIGRLIQWQTRSVYSHASVVLDRHLGVIESREFKGVRHLPGLDPAEAVDLFQVVWSSGFSRSGLPVETSRRVAEFLFAQVGKPYDYTMVARFISRRSSPGLSEDKWFCSELVFAAFLHAGIPLLERVEPWAVSPGLLALSPLLRPVERSASCPNSQQVGSPDALRVDDNSRSARFPSARPLTV